MYKFYSLRNGSVQTDGPYNNCNSSCDAGHKSIANATSIALDFSVLKKKHTHTKWIETNDSHERQIEIKYDKFVERWNDTHINCWLRLPFRTNWTCSMGIKETQRTTSDKQQRKKRERNKNVWKEIFIWNESAAVVVDAICTLGEKKTNSRTERGRACILHSEKWLSAF